MFTCTVAPVTNCVFLLEAVIEKFCDIRASSSWPPSTLAFPSVVIATIAATLNLPGAYSVIHGIVILVTMACLPEEATSFVPIFRGHFQLTGSDRIPCSIKCIFLVWSPFGPTIRKAGPSTTGCTKLGSFVLLLHSMYAFPELTSVRSNFTKSSELRLLSLRTTNSTGCGSPTFMSSSCSSARKGIAALNWILGVKSFAEPTPLPVTS